MTSNTPSENLSQVTDEMPPPTTHDDLEKTTTDVNPDGHDSTDSESTAKEREEQPPALDWDGPDEPDNAQNWSKAKKAFHIYVFSILGMASTVGVSSYSPAIGAVAEHFHVSHVAATVPLTLYILGQALGPCLAAPISETFGRKGVFLATAPLGLLFTVGTGFSQNFGSLCVLRFFSGIFSSPSLSVGGGIIADMLLPIYRSAATAFWVGVALSGTGLGPGLAGFAVQNKGWRWSQWVFIFVTLTGWIPSLFTSESYQKIVLSRRARARGLHQAGASRSTSKGNNTTSLQSSLSTAKFFLMVTLFRPFAMLIQEPIVAWFAIYCAAIFTVLFSFFEAFPIVFAGVYRFNLGETGLSFLGVFIGITIGITVHLVLDRMIYYKKTLARQARGDSSSLPPEERLYPAMVGAPLISFSLFWFAWSSRAEVHWISSELATVLFAWGAMGVLAPTMQYLLDVYGPLYGASAVGANNLLRYFAGAISPLYTRQMYSALGIDWAGSLLAFVTVLLLPVPFVLFKYGASIRTKSRYGPDGVTKKTPKSSELLRAISAPSA